ncbi:hypothetical protein [Phenylobacterium sp.]|uniref:hypothetical protein n=1 Tax=Phenylobacterium sp. TaxID=1871053 RepID=UPI003982FFD9
MAIIDSALDTEALAKARALLNLPAPRQRLWPVVGAAGFFAVSALAFATAMILAPPLTSTPIAADRAVR